MLTKSDMKALVVLIGATFFLAGMTINLDAEQPGPVPAALSTEPSASAASENKRVPAALREFLDGVAGYGQASSFAILTEINEPALARLFPDDRFFSLVFRMHPVARMVPASLETQNIFIVPKAGPVQHVTNTGQLEHFFKEKLGPRREPADQKAAVQAWLALSQTFVQDGMFQFSVPPDSIKLSRIDTDTNATGKAVITPAGGNRGEIIATLHFTSGGDLTSVKEEQNVQQGVRPICQATRLLDPDPIVRAMAAQDLLVMGRGAMPYLREQRKTAAPELVRAIDAISHQIEVRESAWEKTRVPAARP